MNFITLHDLYQSLGELREQLVNSGASRLRRDLRGTDQKRDRERYQAAIFARAMQGALGVDNVSLGFPEDEYSDHDVVLAWVNNGAPSRLKVQLKELPPATLAPNETIEAIIAKVIERLQRSPDVTVAVFTNRNGGGQKVTVPEHKLAGLLAYGVMGLDPIMVFVIGNIGGATVDATTTMTLD